MKGSILTEGNLTKRISIIRTLFLMISVVIISVILGIVVLGVIYSLPSEMPDQNVTQSVGVFANEKQYPKLYRRFVSTLDNYTDAIMLNEAKWASEGEPFKDAVYARELVAKDIQDPYDRVSSFTYISQNPDCETIPITYSRYWHGYLTVLKPLLYFFNYSQIRVLNFVVQFLLVMVVISLLYFKKMKIYIPAFIMLFILQDIYLTSHSLQFSSVFYIYVIGTILLLLSYNRFGNTRFMVFFFLILGILTCYFDFLTYPLITYGIPASVYLILDEKRSPWLLIRNIIVFGFSWIMGYAGMWVGKGIIGSILVGENLLTEFFSKIAFRSGSGNHGDFSRVSAALKNLWSFMRSATFPAVFLGCLIALFAFIHRASKKKALRRVSVFPQVLPFLLIAFSPFCWYFLAANHSWIHSFFTHKALYITAFALMCILTKTYKDSRPFLKNHKSELGDTNNG